MVLLVLSNLLPKKVPTKVLQPPKTPEEARREKQLGSQRGPGTLLGPKAGHKNEPEQVTHPAPLIPKTQSTLNRADRKLSSTWPNRRNLLGGERKAPGRQLGHWSQVGECQASLPTSQGTHDMTPPGAHVDIQRPESPYRLQLTT